MNDIVDCVRLGYCDHNCAKRFFALMRRRKVDFKFLESNVE